MFKIVKYINYTVAILALMFSAYLFIQNILLGNYFVAFVFAIIASANSVNIYTINMIDVAYNKITKIISNTK